MHRFFSRISCALLVALLCLTPVISAYAANSSPEPVTGTMHVICPLTINILDKTNGAFTDEINVTISDIASGVRYENVIDLLNYNMGFPMEREITGNTTYTVTLSYPGSDIYTIVNSDGTAIDRFAATESGYVFNWVIGKSGEQFLTGASSDMLAGTSSDVSDDEILEGEKLFAEFLSAVEHIKTDVNWDKFFRVYRLWEEQQAEEYAKFEGGTMEEWKEKSDFDKFIWYETYLNLVKHMNFGSYDSYFGTEKTFVNSVIINVPHGFKIYGGKDAPETQPYMDLMLWQYRFFVKNGTFYNFLTGKTYLETINGAKPVDADEERKAAQEQEQKELEEARREIEESEDGEEVLAAVQEIAEASPSVSPTVIQDKQNSGIWDKTLEVLKNNIITLILLFVVVIALLCVILYRKSKAVKKD